MLGIFRFLFVAMLAGQLIAGEDYKFGLDSEEHEGVPKGAVTEYKFNESKIYPGTNRSYWIYLPPNFDAQAEYPIMIFFDGGGCVSPKGQFRVPTVFDNLIQKKEIPALVGLFINPGDVPPVAKGARGRSTRSYEYDTPDDGCAKFLISEMIPLAAKHAKISAKPENRALWGISSGGIAAFSAAWFRPDAFGKVISYIGSFTNIRGAYWFPSAVRKTERKPIRVVLQEGSTDLDNVHGNWPLGNQELANALKFAGYDYKFVMGDGGHSGKQGGAILPDALRWLWRPAEPLPKPTPEVANDMALSGIIIPGEEWKLVTERNNFVVAACTDADGNFYFSDLGEGIFKIDAKDAVTPFNTKVKGISGMKFGPDGRLYACAPEDRKLIAIDKEGKIEELHSGKVFYDLVVTHSGHIYITQAESRNIWMRDLTGKLRVVDEGGSIHLGIVLSPNQETLAVSDYGSLTNTKSSIWAFRVESDGSLGAKMPIMPYREFGHDLEDYGRGMVCDTRARYYCATIPGIQTFDPNGRPIGMILPPATTPVPSLALSGPGLNYLYALTEGKVFKRKVNATGFVTSLPPILNEEKKK